MFYAAWIPAVTADAVWDRLGDLRSRLRSVRWIPPARYHVTLQFLGEVPVGRGPELARLLSTAAARQPAAATLGTLGTFPSRGRPSVLWLGVECPLLVDIHRHLESGLADLGFPRERRPFRPHVTVGRMRRSSSRSISLEGPALRDRVFPVDRIHLVASDLLPDGPRYRFLHTVALSGPPVAGEGGTE